MAGRKLEIPVPPAGVPSPLWLQRIPLPAELSGGRATLAVRIQADNCGDATTATFFGLALVSD